MKLDGLTLGIGLVAGCLAACEPVPSKTGAVNNSADKTADSMASIPPNLRDVANGYYPQPDNATASTWSYPVPGSVQTAENSSPPPGVTAPASATDVNHSAIAPGNTTSDSTPVSNSVISINLPTLSTQAPPSEAAVAESLPPIPRTATATSYSDTSPQPTTASNLNSDVGTAVASPQPSAAVNQASTTATSANYSNTTTVNQTQSSAAVNQASNTTTPANSAANSQAITTVSGAYTPNNFITTVRGAYTPNQTITSVASRPDSTTTANNYNANSSNAISTASDGYAPTYSAYQQVDNTVNYAAETTPATITASNTADTPAQTSNQQASDTIVDRFATAPGSTAIASRYLISPRSTTTASNTDQHNRMATNSVTPTPGNKTITTRSANTANAPAANQSLIEQLRSSRRRQTTAATKLSAAGTNQPKQAMNDSNAAAFGLIMAQQQGQVYPYTSTWLKAQDAITLLRQGKTQQEAAQRSGISLSMLKQLIERGQARL